MSKRKTKQREAKIRSMNANAHHFHMSRSASRQMYETVGNCVNVVVLYIVAAKCYPGRVTFGCRLAAYLKQWQYWREDWIYDIVFPRRIGWDMLRYPGMVPCNYPYCCLVGGHFLFFFGLRFNGVLVG